MASLDTFVGKYIRLTEDLHEMRAYLNDIRICFVALTVSCYVVIVMYAFVLCLGRRDDDGSVAAARRASRFRNGAGGQPRRSVNYDAEIGGGAETNEWDDMMPPPPNGGAVKTVDGYRYRNPSRGSAKQLFQSQNRLSVPEPSEPMGVKRQQLAVDTRAGTAAPVGGALYSSRGSPGENAFRDGFIEKSPSIT